MTREQDWRIHEYMGNDLTGWEWFDSHEENNAVILKDADGKLSKGFRIPHYSTTWEGAGLVMEWLRSEKIPFNLRYSTIDETYVSCVSNRMHYDDDSAPQALAKAYISAMEERDNG